MIINCNRIKPKEIINISPKALLVKCYDGSQDVLPKSLIHKYDGDSIWVASWVLQNKTLQYSYKTKQIDVNTGKFATIIRKHIPKQITKTPVINKTLIK